MNSRADRRRKTRAEALRAGTATSEAQLRAARGYAAFEASVSASGVYKCRSCGHYNSWHLGGWEPKHGCMNCGYGKVEAA